MPLRTNRVQRLFLTMAVCMVLAAAASAQGSEEVYMPPAAEEVVVRLTLEQALAMAEEDSPILEERRALIRAGEASERLAQSVRMPDLDASARASRLSDVPEYAITQPDGSRNVVFPNIPNRYGAMLDLRVPLYTGGRTRWGTEAAQWSTAAAAGDLAVAEDDLRLWVTDAFFRGTVRRGTGPGLCCRDRSVRIAPGRCGKPHPFRPGGKEQPAGRAGGAGQSPAGQVGGRTRPGGGGRPPGQLAGIASGGGDRGRRPPVGGG